MVPLILIKKVSFDKVTHVTKHKTTHMNIFSLGAVMVFVCYIK